MNTDWQPIETCPEQQWVLVYPNYDTSGASVGSFVWRVEKEMVEVSRRGKRVTYEESETRKREWTGAGWGATHWMPLPPPPEAADKE